jgi:chorismate lyase/3-hydroxybenzoate synthase
MVHCAGTDSCLFISGTAAILSHATVHAGDSLRQCETTLENLRAVLARAGLPDPAGLGGRAAWKVYLRRREDYEPVSALLATALAPESPVLYLAGDICREDLLLEIEGLVHFRGIPARPSAAAFSP